MSQNAIVEYRKTIDSLDYLDGSINYDNNLNLPPNKALFIRVIKAQLSRQLPNIYQLGNFDNTRIAVTRDGGATWWTVVLPPGIYTIEYLEAAINEAVAQAPHNWWTLPSDPGFNFTYNLATTKTSIRMDSSKLAGFTDPPPPTTQLGIDFDTYSSAYMLMGIPAGTGAIYDTAYPGGPYPSVYNAPNYPQFDTQGTACDVSTSFNLIYRYINSKNTDVVASIPLTGADEAHDEYLYPLPGQVSPYMQVTNTASLAGLSIQLLGSRGRRLVATEGNFFIEIEISAQ